MADPIEITAKDLVERPENWAAAGQPAAKVGGGGWMEQFKQVQEFLKMLPELRAAMKDLQGMTGGLNLGGLVGGQQPPQLAAPASGAVDQTAAQANQLGMLLKVLQMTYGDLTIDELFAKLKHDFGGKRLSQIGGGFLR